MWRVFEDFAGRFYEREQDEYRVQGPTADASGLYPTVGRETRVDFTHDLRFQARSVDLGKPWQQIHEAMLSALA